MERVTVTRVNETYDRISGDAGVLQEIADHFTHFAPNYKYHPRYKTRAWDGKISLFSAWKPRFPVGLRSELQKFCDSNGYGIDWEFNRDPKPFTHEEALRFISGLNLPKEMNGLKFEVRDYQLDAFVKCVQERRLTLLSPTASGKSLIIYLVLMYFNAKSLVIVPTLQLVKQMTQDFKEYGYGGDVHQIFSGKEKESDLKFTVSTWQSLKNAKPSFLNRFEVLIDDEVHGAKAASLKKTVEAMTDVPIRIGTTGTLDDEVLNRLTIQGLFGPVFKVITTAELMEKGQLADLSITSVVLSYSEAERKAMVKSPYPDEMKFLIGHPKRNEYLTNMAVELGKKGNVLVLFQFVELHGEPLHELISSKADCPVLYVSGKVGSEDREEIRKFVNDQKRSITVASKGCFSTGTNIPNINYIIFVSPSKAKIQTLQSIGRGLRKSSVKSECKLYDVADDLSWKSWVNHTLNHYVERVRIYKKEKFRHKVVPVVLTK